ALAYAREDVGAVVRHDEQILRRRLGGDRPHHTSRSARWMSCTHTDPSPTADATRLMLPDRTSPAANTPGVLGSTISGPRASGHPAASSSAGWRSAPVLAKPLSSSATHPFNHAVLGSAPVIRKTCRIGRVSMAPLSR